MAEHTENPARNRQEDSGMNTANPLLTGLALIGGVGLTLMSVGLAIGVIQGEQANTAFVGAMFWTGLVLLFGASVAWFAVAQPHKHFDDINQPQYTGHHDEDH